MTVLSDPGPPGRRFLQLADVAEVLNISRRQVYALVRQRRPAGDQDRRARSVAGRGERARGLHRPDGRPDARLRDHHRSAAVRGRWGGGGEGRRSVGDRRPGGGPGTDSGRATTLAPTSLTWPVRRERTSASAPNGTVSTEPPGAADLTGRVLGQLDEVRADPFQRPFDGGAPDEADHDRRPVARHGAQRDPQPQSHPLTPGRRRPVRGRGQAGHRSARRTSRRGPGHRRRPRTPRAAATGRRPRAAGRRPGRRPPRGRRPGLPATRRAARPASAAPSRRARSATRVDRRRLGGVEPAPRGHRTGRPSASPPPPARHPDRSGGRAAPSPHPAEPGDHPATTWATCLWMVD